MIPTDSLSALRKEIDEMVIDDKEKVELAEQIIVSIDYLTALLGEFNNK